MLLHKISFIVDLCYLKRVLFLHFRCWLLFSNIFSLSFFFPLLLFRSYYFLYAKLFLNVDRFFQYTFFMRKKRYFRLFTKYMLHGHRRQRRTIKFKFFWSNFIKCSSYYKGSQVMLFLKKVPRYDYKIMKYLSFLFSTSKINVNTFWFCFYYEKVFFFDLLHKFLLSVIFFKIKYLFYLKFIFILLYKKIFFFFFYSLSTFSSFQFYKSFIKVLLLNKNNASA